MVDVKTLAFPFAGKYFPSKMSYSAEGIIPRYPELCGRFARGVSALCGFKEGAILAVFSE